MIFYVTNRSEVDDTVYYDLVVDGVTVLKRESYMTIFNHLLTHMADTDLYRYSEQPNDDDPDPDLTGLHLRMTHVLRQAQIAAMAPEACVRCEGETTWIGYCDIQPYFTYPLQHTFFLQCRQCGYYVQTGFANGDIWQTDSSQALMQNRAPWVRTASDPFIRNGTLRVSSRVGANYMGRLNLDGHEYHCGEPITVYDQQRGSWRDGRIEYGDNWYFTSNDGYPDLQLRQGMRARRRAGGYGR
jgi:hypothetical protein